MPPPDPADLLLRQFLAWVADRPRGYAETMAAWRTSCPRLPVWEDATEGGLVRLELEVAGTTQGEVRVVLTTAGRAVLAAAAGSAVRA
ncbi:hypothetical protein [Paracraurococcus ruber]|uniref:Uncharacterized protein n=1 Tax=Paracraurococcus ruber TaxID=77675 RepID=A0ABS1D0E3_9PROT|nr:hypothetical protein [Paracraurococcus ruber]MBK1660270.1 hypothetical protein [Paracraurococcus ruber]TDG28002.1 hypothetical protein E2C05_21625 [Paracraurococcus ruber]